MLFISFCPIHQKHYEKFRTGEKLVMLATKAFGMGVDISDIAIVAHFAPTGNVCDYDAMKGEYIEL